MAEKTKKDTKKIIMETAISLFAKKGYDAVGIREIASAAGVHLSLINYYFQGKVGILREIVNETYSKYYEALASISDESLPLEDRLRKLIRNLISFFRGNLELAIAGIRAIPLDRPDIIDLRLKWIMDNRGILNKWFTEFGLDVNDEIKMSVIRNFLTSVLFNHFENKYAWDIIMTAKEKPRLLEKPGTDCCAVSEDEYYDRYAEILATIYLNGIKSVAEIKQGE